MVYFGTIPDSYTLPQSFFYSFLLYYHSHKFDSGFIFYLKYYIFDAFKRFNSTYKFFFPLSNELIRFFNVVFFKLFKALNIFLIFFRILSYHFKNKNTPSSIESTVLDEASYKQYLISDRFP